VLRVAGFATAVRRSLMPVAAEVAARQPRLRLLIHEHEPAEAFARLDSDDVDLALVYDYTRPGGVRPAIETSPLWTAAWSLGVPARDAERRRPATRSPCSTRFRDRSWIVNSRNTADERAVRTVASMAGFEPAVAHRADSLDLVEDLIVAGLGVGLLPEDHPTRPGVALLPLDRPGITLRSYTAVRRGGRPGRRWR
jgi:DNA-binding transcriptional LysR family regulator